MFLATVKFTDETVDLWDPTTGDHVAQLCHGELTTDNSDDNMYKVFSCDLKHHYLVSLRGSLKTHEFSVIKWNTVSNTMVQYFRIGDINAESITCNHDATLAAITAQVCEEFHIIMYHIDEGSELWRMNCEAVMMNGGCSAAFSHDGQHIICATMHDTRVEVWSADGSHRINMVDIVDVLDLDDEMHASCITTSEFSNIMAFGVFEHVVVIDDFTISTEYRSIKLNTKGLPCVCLGGHNDHEIFVSNAGEIVVYDVITLLPKRSLGMNGARRWVICWNPFNNTLMTIHEDGVRMNDPVTGEVVRMISASGVQRLRCCSLSGCSILM